MDKLVATLKLGGEALLFKEEAYEEMRVSADPVLRGLIMVLVVGAVIALVGLVGTGLELASMPNLNQMREIIHDYILQMPFWPDVLRDAPDALAHFEEWYGRSWDWLPRLFGATSIGGAALGIIWTPLGLVLRWLLYGLVAYLFARWLGGTASLSETLGVLALSVAPQVLNLFGILPFVEVGMLVAVWGVLCAYVGLKTAHKLSWARAMWATLLPFIVGGGILIVLGCVSTAILRAVIGGFS